MNPVYPIDSVTNAEDKALFCASYKGDLIFLKFNAKDFFEEGISLKQDEALKIAAWIVFSTGEIEKFSEILDKIIERAENGENMEGVSTPAIKEINKSMFKLEIVDE